jgi:hypothetical protein
MPSGLFLMGDRQRKRIGHGRCPHFRLGEEKLCADLFPWKNPYFCLNLRLPVNEKTS